MVVVLLLFTTRRATDSPRVEPPSVASLPILTLLQLPPTQHLTTLTTLLQFDLHNFESEIVLHQHCHFNCTIVRCGAALLTTQTSVVQLLRRIKGPLVSLEETVVPWKVNCSKRRMDLISQGPCVLRSYAIYPQFCVQTYLFPVRLILLLILDLCSRWNCGNIAR